MDDSKPVSVTKFVVGTLAVVLVLNLVLWGLLGLGGVPVTLGVSIGVAGLAAWWFAKSVGRVPTRQERSRFLWLYSGILALPFIAIVLMASLRGSLSITGLLILFLHYIPYPAFAQMFFSDKYITMSLRK